jgi:hypothetical protein
LKLKEMKQFVQSYKIHMWENQIPGALELEPALSFPVPREERRPRAVTFPKSHSQFTSVLGLKWRTPFHINSSFQQFGWKARGAHSWYLWCTCCIALAALAAVGPVYMCSFPTDNPSTPCFICHLCVSTLRRNFIYFFVLVLWY